MSDPANNDDLGDKLKQLAMGVLDDLLDVSGDKMSLDARIDAIKVIGNLHLGLRRVGDKVPSPDEDAGPTFLDMRARVDAAGGK